MSTGALVFNIVFLALVALFLIFIGWLIWLFFTGRQRRGQQQLAEFGSFPAPPADPGEFVVGPTECLYLGTTRVENWIDRVQVDDVGDRAPATATGYTHGVAIERRGAATIWIPRDDLVAVRTTNRAASKVMHAGGILAFDWTLPSRAGVTTAIRADDKAVYPHWLVAFPGTAEPTDPNAAE
ncbi:hypothetical protein GOARA_064_00600 [Gordonia araii NBRC 100433]|uniref:PH domain-containing protein n=1 Tax=Gordonia araii NBRC 100433 TaxID=1073574 RepID=G7H5D3_9ACTN|nr:hypothetical protein [Gordonia araii]NNG95772.1 transporter [Gordonia araii NBRC 100433]GAB11058.1 hypothetical protein GOARA_064_00600 [Gordonia araii NBRC 100433]